MLARQKPGQPRAEREGVHEHVVSLQSLYPLTGRHCRRENGGWVARDADASLVLRPYLSLALGPELKGHTLCHEHAGQNFGFPDRGPRATLCVLSSGGGAR